MIFAGVCSSSVKLAKKHKIKTLFFVIAFFGVVFGVPYYYLSVGTSGRILPHNHPVNVVYSMTPDALTEMEKYGCQPEAKYLQVPILY
jgi:hypothetical protein